MPNSLRNFTAQTILPVAVCLCVLLSAFVPRCVGQTAQPPTKNDLIKTLNSLYPLLESNDFNAALKHFIVPPNFKPAMLSGLIDQQEISMPGIKRLEKEATFGTASSVFGIERAKHFAQKADVSLEHCYGFNHTVQSSTAEVIGVWNGTKFKLIRLDDIGKLAPLQDQPNNSEMRSEKTQEHAKGAAADLSKLRSAVDAAPNDVSARAKYAMALFKLGNLPEAWTQLIQARNTDPKHDGIAKGLSVVFTEFSRKGLFTVGVPQETIESVLGVANKKIELPNKRIRWVYAFYAVDFKDGRIHEVIDLRGATNALFSPTEIVSIELDGRGWRCGFRSKKKGNSAAHWYLPGESIENWTEEFVVERFLDGANLGSVKKITELMIAQVTAIHPNAKHRILSQNEDSVIISLMLPEKPNFKPQQKLVRLIKGTDDLHRFAISIRNADAPPREKQAKWLAIFNAAKLISPREAKSGSKQ